MDLSIDHSTTLGMAFHGGNHGRRGRYALARRLQRRQLDRVPAEPEPAAGRCGRRARPGDRRHCRTCSAPASASRRSASCSMRSPLAATPTCSRRRTSSRPTTSPAEINVGENIPLQTNVGGVPGLGSLGRSLGARGGRRSAGDSIRSRSPASGRRLQRAAPGRRHQDQGHAAHQRVEPGAARDRGGDQRARAPPPERSARSRSPSAPRRRRSSSTISRRS